MTTNPRNRDAADCGLVRIVEVAAVLNQLRPQERIAAFFSVELPCGTTMVTAMPAREPAKAS